MVCWHSRRAFARGVRRALLHGRQPKRRLRYGALCPAAHAPRHAASRERCARRAVGGARRHRSFSYSRTPWQAAAGAGVWQLHLTTWNEPLYIIDEKSHFVYRRGLAPLQYKPAEVRKWLAAKYGAVKQGAKTAAASASRASAPATTSSEGTTSLSGAAKSEK